MTGATATDESNSSGGDMEAGHNIQQSDTVTSAPVLTPNPTPAPTVTTPLGSAPSNVMDSWNNTTPGQTEPQTPFEAPNTINTAPVLTPAAAQQPIGGAVNVDPNHPTDSQQSFDSYMESNPGSMPQVVNPTPAPQNTNVFGDIVTTLEGFSPVAMAGAAAVPAPENDSTDINGFDLTSQGATNNGLGPVSLNGFAPGTFATGSPNDPINQMTGPRNVPSDIGDIDNEAELQRQQNVFGLDGLVTLGGVPYASDSAGGFYNLRTGQEVSDPTTFSELKQGGDSSGIQPWNAASLAKQYNSDGIGNFFGNVTNPITEQGTMVASTPKMVDWTYSTGQQQSAVLSPEQPVTMGVGTGSEWASAMPVVTTGGQDMSDIRYAPGVGFIDAFGSGTEDAGDALGGVGSGYLWAQGTDYHTPDGTWITGQATANPTLATTSGTFLPGAGSQVLPSSLPDATSFTAPVATALGLSSSPAAQPSPVASGSEGQVANALITQSLWPTQLPPSGQGNFTLSGVNGTAVNQAMVNSMWPSLPSTQNYPSPQATPSSDNTSVGGFDLGNLFGIGQASAAVPVGWSLAPSFVQDQGVLPVTSPSTPSSPGLINSLLNLGSTDLTLPLGGGSGSGILSDIGGALGKAWSGVASGVSNAWNDISNGDNPATGRSWLDLQSPLAMSLTPAQLNMSESQAVSSLSPTEYAAYVNQNLANNTYLNSTQLGYSQAQAKQNLDPTQYSVWNKMQVVGGNDTSGIYVGSNANPFADLQDWASGLKGNWALPAMIGSDIISVLPAGVGLAGTMAGKVADLGSLGVEEGPISDMLGSAASKLSDAWDSGVDAVKSSPLGDTSNWYTFGKVTPPGESTLSQDEKDLSDWSELSPNDRIASRIASRDANAYTPPGPPSDEPTTSAMAGKYDIISRIVNRDAAADASMKDIQWQYGADNAGSFFTNLDKDLGTAAPIMPEPEDEGYVPPGPTFKPPTQGIDTSTGDGINIGDGIGTGINIGSGLGDGGVPPTPPVPPISGTLQGQGLGLPGDLFGFPDLTDGAGGTGGTGETSGTGETGETITTPGPDTWTPSMTITGPDEYTPSPDLGDTDEEAPTIPGIPLILPSMPAVGAPGPSNNPALRYFTYKNNIWSFSPFYGNMGDFDAGGVGLGSSSMFDDGNGGNAGGFGAMDFSSSAVAAGFNGAGDMFDSDMNDMGNSIGAASSSGMFDVPAESFLNQDEADGMPSGQGYNDPYTVHGRRIPEGQMELGEDGPIGSPVVMKLGDTEYIRSPRTYPEYDVKEWGPEDIHQFEDSNIVQHFKPDARPTGRMAVNSFLQSAYNARRGDKKHPTRLITAEHSGRLEGVAAFGDTPFSPDIPVPDDYLYIEQMAGSGRRGAGSRLLRHIAGEAAKRGTGLAGETRKTDEAEDFYGKMGATMYVGNDYSGEGTPYFIMWDPEQTRMLAEGREPRHQWIRRREEVPIYYDEDTGEEVDPFIGELHGYPFELEEQESMFPLNWTKHVPAQSGRRLGPGQHSLDDSAIYTAATRYGRWGHRPELLDEPEYKPESYQHRLNEFNGRGYNPGAGYHHTTIALDEPAGTRSIAKAWKLAAEPGLRRKKFTTMWSGDEVDIVNGSYIRDTTTEDYLLGSNPQADPALVPPRHLYVSDINPKAPHGLHDLYGVITHEGSESGAMQHGFTYRPAHRMFGERGEELFRNTVSANASEKEMWLASNKIIAMETAKAAATKHPAGRAYGMNFEGVARTGFSKASSYGVDTGGLGNVALSVRDAPLRQADYGSGFASLKLDFGGLGGTGRKQKGYDYGDAGTGMGIGFDASDIGMGSLNHVSAKTARKTMKDAVGDTLGFGIGAIGMGMGIGLGMNLMSSFTNSINTKGWRW
jgi:hypothetical protein